MKSSIRNFIVIISIFILNICHLAHAESSSANTPELSTLPITETADNKVKFGMFINNLHDINFAKSEFQVEFWSWFISPNKDYFPQDRTEIVNSKKFSIRNSTRQTIDNYFLHSQVFKGTIKQHWDIERFPFDTQKLSISLEDTIDTKQGIEFIMDDTSGIANDLIPEGWEFKDFKLTVSDNNYPTTFGDPRVQKDNNYKFSRATATITLKRNGSRIFITSFLGLFVATVLIMIVFSINSFSRSLAVIPLQPRITLCVGALFSAVGSIYGLSAKIPYTTMFTLSDSIQITTFIGIAFAIISSVSSDILIKINQQKLQNKLMIVIWALFLFSHFGMNGYLIYTAL